MSKNGKLNLNLDDLFIEELQSMKNEINEIDNLYKETKEHYDRVKSSKSSGVLQFVQQQTGNLINIKTNKFHMLKEVANIKKMVAELSVKEFNANVKVETTDNQDNNAIVKNLFSLLLNERRDDIIEKTNIEENQSVEEIDIDSLLEERLNEVEREMEEVSNTNNSNDEEHRNFKYVVDSEKNIYVVDNDYNIIEGKDIPDFVIEFKDTEEGLKAFNQFGEEIEIIEVE